jgi:ketosteroid isomerase-like protein
MPTDSGSPARNLETARRYLAALEQGVTGPALAAFFTPDAEQTEFPNRLTPTGAVRDVPALLAGAVRGQQVVSAQTFAITNALAAGDHVALEVDWTGTLAIPIASLPAGGQMRAHFAVFIEFRDGLIYRQRNYDCFEPF